jgi:hypothetical protein
VRFVVQVTQSKKRDPLSKIPRAQKGLAASLKEQITYLLRILEFNPSTAKKIKINGN